MTTMMNEMMIGMTMRTMPDHDSSHHHCHVMAMMIGVVNGIMIRHHRHHCDAIMTMPYLDPSDHPSHHHRQC